MKRRCWLLVLATLLLGFYACPSFAVDASLRAFRGLEGELKIVGGTAPMQLMKGAARRIMNFNPSIKISVAGGGSLKGIRAVGEGRAQISNSGRPLLDEEIEQYGLACVPFATDWIAIAVHPRNPVTTLTMQDLKGIYSGEVTNWKDVGGPDAPIEVLGREDGSGARSIFEARVLGGAPGIGRQLGSNGAVKDELSQAIYAIGFLAVSAVDKSIKALKIDGLAPTADMVVSGQYPLVRELYMNFKKAPDELTKKFIAYIRSPAGAELIRKSGFIPSDSDRIQISRDRQ